MKKSIYTVYHKTFEEESLMVYPQSLICRENVCRFVDRLANNVSKIVCDTQTIMQTQTTVVLARCLFMVSFYLC